MEQIGILTGTLCPTVSFCPVGILSCPIEVLKVANSSPGIGPGLPNSWFRPLAIAWTKNPKLLVGWSLMVANDVSIPRDCFAKISEFLKTNLLSAAHI